MRGLPDGEAGWTWRSFQTGWPGSSHGSAATTSPVALPARQRPLMMGRAGMGQIANKARMAKQLDKMARKFPKE